jgi:hypothetical protein
LRRQRVHLLFTHKNPPGELFETSHMKASGSNLDGLPTDAQMAAAIQLLLTCPNAAIFFEKTKAKQTLGQKLRTVPPPPYPSLLA